MSGHPAPARPEIPIQDGSSGTTRLGNPGQTAYARPRPAPPNRECGAYRDVGGSLEPCSPASREEMRASGLRMLKRGAGVLSGIAAAGMAAQARAADLLGQPTPGATMSMQPSAAPLRDDQAWLLNTILHPVAITIALFVLVLLLIVIFRFNKRSNPTPARWSHNTPIEVIWTVLPVLILAVIAIFSFRLLYEFHTMPRPDVTVKATGNQWYWT